MFPARYFAKRFFPERYFPDYADNTAPEIPGMEYRMLRNRLHFRFDE